MPIEQDLIHLPVPDSARRAVESLVDRYSRGAADYESSGYNEAQARIEFIDPLFEALGWDIANKEGYAEPYKDVVHEDAIRVAGRMKAPDYCFRIGGQRKFFLEAKKPSVSVKTDVAPAYQLRRYAWSAKLPLSVLTDFQELAVYDCRERPKQTDSSSVARIEYLTYDQYPDQLDHLYSTFSRDAILKGSFDRYAQATKGKRGTSEVDDAFLAEIEAWREALAKDIARGNPDLSVHDLNFAVQRTVDRILFLRIAEDRGIEPHGRLQELAKRHSLYEQLCALYQEADGKYNAGLFDFTKEGDALTLRLTLSDRVIRDIVKRLYYPDCPYEFSVIPADILGAVYERFLGKVIRLTAGHHAKVEEKPEVRKAGGVYYTPKYIVDYIVEHTVGALLGEEGPHGGDRPQDGGPPTGPVPPSANPPEGPHEHAPCAKSGPHPSEGPNKRPQASPSGPHGGTPCAPTPNQPPASALPALRILDPACGSGSFLLGAYQYLLDWHLKYYMAHDPKKHAKGRQPRVVQVGENDYRLTNAERKRILLDSIYGVDIDLQAVEVTKLNLLLKCMEGESAQQLRLLHDRVLPNIDANIKCGNSLIGPDYWEGRQTAMFDEEETRRVNPFDWHREFPTIMNKGGFDAVIGNPPYIRIQNLQEFWPEQAAHVKSHYVSAAKGSADIYVTFVERGLTLAGSAGLLGFIVPSKFMASKYGAALRGLLGEGSHVRHLVDFGSEQVFAGATTYTCLLFLSQSATEEFPYARVRSLADWRSSGTAETAPLRLPDEPSEEWSLVVGPGSELHRRLALAFPPLEALAEVFVGVQTSADDVYILDAAGPPQTERVTIQSKALDVAVTLERDLLRPLTSGTDVTRFGPLPERQYVIFPYDDANGRMQLVPWVRMAESCPSAAQYLLANRQRLESRERGRMRTPSWYAYVYPKNLARQHLPKVCVPRLVHALHCTVDDGTHCLDNVDVCGVVWREAYAGHSLLYLVGLLNSGLLRWYFPTVSAPFRGGWLSANRQFLGRLPLRPIDLDDPEDVAKHDRMVWLVQTMLDLHKSLHEANTPSKREIIERQIDATDHQIDTLVYDLYGLTPAEIAIVENVAGTGEPEGQG